MLKISRKQAGERYDTLPENIREALFSENNVNTIWRFGEANHLSEEKIEEVATVAGDVLMGFLHSDINDVTQEIQERINIPKQLASDIAKELDKKIFSQFKNELERIYAPIDSSRSKNLPEAPEIIVKPEKIIPTPQVIKPSSPTSDIQGLRPTFEIKIPTFRDIKPAEPVTQEKTEQIKKPESQAVKEVESHLTNDSEPFLLHEEKPLFSPEAPPEKPSVSFESGTKRFFSKKPIIARIETPEEEKLKKQEARVVHYSNLRTPLNTNNK